MALPRLRFFLPATLVLLLGLILGLVVFRLPLCEWLLPRLAASHGLEGLSVDLADLSLSRLRVNSLSCSLPGTATTTLAVSGIDLSYSLSELLEGQIDSLNVDRLDLNLPPPQGGDTLQPHRLLDLLTTNWSERLPLRRLTIDQLLLHGTLASAMIDTPMTLHLTNSQETIRGQAELMLDQHPLTVLLTVDRSREYSYTIAKPGSQPLLGGSLQARGGALTGSQQLDLAGLRQLFPRLRQLDQGMEGELSFNYIADLRTFSLGLNGNFESLALAGHTVAKGSFHLKAGLGLNPLFLRVNSPSELRFQDLQGEGLQIASGILPLNGSIRAMDQTLHLSSLSDSPWQLQHLTSQGVQIDRVSLLPLWTMDFTDGHLAARLGKALRLRLSGTNLADRVRVAEFELSPGEAGQEVSLERSDERIRLRSGKLRLAPMVIHLSDALKVDSGIIDIDPGALTLQRKTGNWSLPLTAQSQSLTLTKDGIVCNLGLVRLESAMDQNLVRGTARTSPKTVPGALLADFRHWLVEGKGELSIISDQPLDFSDTELSLSDLITLPQQPMELSNGVINFSASANWNRRSVANLAARIQISEGAGTLGSSHFSGLDLDQHLQFTPELRSLSPGSLHIANVDTGVALQKIALVSNLAPSELGPKPVLSLSSIDGWTLGGHIQCDNATYDFNQPDVQSVVRISDLSLPRLNAISQIKGLQVDGRINGILPLRLKGRQLWIEQGQMTSSGPGTIRYQPPGDGMAVRDRLTDFAVKALEEFHYQEFSTDVSYLADGTLTTQMHLKGTSPGLETDRPVHLNISTEQNLLSLLKSLQYSKALTSEIDQQVERKYHPSIAQ